MDAIKYQAAKVQKDLDPRHSPRVQAGQAESDLVCNLVVQHMEILWYSTTHYGVPSGCAQLGFASTAMFSSALRTFFCCMFKMSLIVSLDSKFALQASSAAGKCTK